MNKQTRKFFQLQQECVKAQENWEKSKTIENAVILQEAQKKMGFFASENKELNRVFSQSPSN